MKKKRRKSPPFRVAKAGHRRFSADVIEDGNAMFGDPAYRRLQETGFPDYDEEEAIPRRGGRPFTAEDEPPPRWRRPAYDHDDDDEEYREPEEALRYSLR